MFVIEEQFRRQCKEYGWSEALETYGDISSPSDLTSYEASKSPSIAKRKKLPAEPCIVEFNKHFIEFTGPSFLDDKGQAGGENEPRIAAFWGLALLVPFLLGVVVVLGFLIHATLETGLGGRVSKWKVELAWMFAGVALLIICSAVRVIFESRSMLFIELRNRYRFNRDTGQVYVLRLRRYGGNMVLDWNRVQAHMSWAPPLDAEQQREKAQRFNEEVTDYQIRILRREHKVNEWDLISVLIGVLMTLWPDVPRIHRDSSKLRRAAATEDGHLMLVWPALTPQEAANAEDAAASRSKELAVLGSPKPAVIWLGPKGRARPMWDFLCGYMQYGLPAVEAPQSTQYLGKGSSVDASWSLRLAERLCRWPEFPKEWDSNRGQPDAKT